MTQPGVSQHLVWIEEHFKAALVIRDRRRFELTEAGQKVRDYARAMFSEHERFLGSLKGDQPTEGTLRFASPGSFGMKMYSFLLSLADRHPGLIASYEFAPNASVIAAVRAERIDVGFVNQFPPDHADLEVESIDKEALCLVVPASFRSKKFSALQELGFVSHPDGPYYAMRVLQHMFPNEFEGLTAIPQKGWVNTLMRIPDAVALGQGFTALPEFACQAYPEQKKIRYFTPPGMTHDTIYAIRRKYVPLPKRYDYVLKTFKKEASAL